MNIYRQPIERIYAVKKSKKINKQVKEHDPLEYVMLPLLFIWFISMIITFVYEIYKIIKGI